jgi:hypothetical protein
MTPPQENQNVAMQQNMAVLDQVKKQRGKGERLTTEQILEKSLEGTNQNPLQVQAALAQLVKTDPKFRIMRSNNTLFIYYNMGNGNAFITMQTADNPKNLVEAMSDAAVAAKAAGYKTGLTDIDNPQMLKALQMAKIKYSLQPGQGLMPDGATPRQQVLMEF